MLLICCHAVVCEVLSCKLVHFFFHLGFSSHESAEEDEIPNDGAEIDASSDFWSTNDDEHNYAHDDERYASSVFEETLEEPEELHNLTLAEELLLFMLLFKISRRAMEHLLLVLDAHNVQVPRSVFLLKSQCNPDSFNFVTIPGKDIAYCSMIQHIKYCIEKGHLNLRNTVNRLTVHINIDGLPLFKSSNLNLWPMLMTIRESSYKKPFPLAVFCGLGKPALQTFLSNFICEVKKLKTSVTDINGYPVLLSDVVFICDAPARAYLQCVLGHSAKNGCSYCRIVGRKENGIVFPYSGYENLSALTRNEEAYNLGNENNQYCVSPLNPVCSLRYSFPPEFMHSVCLGVVRRLCEYYFVGITGMKLPCKLSAALKEKVSNQIIYLRKYMPSNFSKKLRPLNEFAHYKALEFRMIVLYLGPVILKDVLPPEFYSHFLLLHFSVYCFCSPLYHRVFFSEAQGCIERFCESSEGLFNNRLQTYNCHIIRHIPEFVSRYGVLDSWSSFVYENYLGVLKRRLKCTRGMYKQTVNNLNVINHLFTNDSGSEILFSSVPPNNCAMLADGRMIFITCVANKVVSGILLTFSHTLYDYPYSSEMIKIGFYRLTDKTVINEIPFSKCIIVPHDKNIFLVLPMVNNECYTQ